MPTTRPGVNPCQCCVCGQVNLYISAILVTKLLLQNLHQLIPSTSFRDLQIISKDLEIESQNGRRLIRAAHALQLSHFGNRSGGLQLAKQTPMRGNDLPICLQSGNLTKLFPANDVPHISLKYVLILQTILNREN
jgi:hypothetical protein